MTFISEIDLDIVVTYLQLKMRSIYMSNGSKVIVQTDTYETFTFPLSWVIIKNDGITEDLYFAQK